MTMRRRATVAGLGLLTLCSVGIVTLRNPTPRRGHPAPKTPQESLYSNITAADYVGPEACGECHPGRYEQWSHSLHRVMNREIAVDRDAVAGDFSGGTLHYAGGAATFELRDGEPTMSLRGPNGVVRRFRVTRTIGTKYFQEYVGILSAGPESNGDSKYTTEVRLPFGYWVARKRWFHQQYFDSWYGAEFDDDGVPTVDAYDVDSTPWASRCAWCHNTYPFEVRARRAASHNVGQGRERYFDFDPGAHAGSTTLPVDSLVTVGISCESCHLGGREHAVGGRNIDFLPRGHGLRLRADAPELSGGRENSTLINTTCAQCHSTPADRYVDGSVTRNSSEALDMASGACMAAIKCTDCHDPHVKGYRNPSPCVQCHLALSDPVEARRHSGHDADEAHCLDCHMPKTVQGITGFVRTHHISAPTSPAVWSKGGLNACNLCHLDRSAEWTRRRIDEHWGHRLPKTSGSIPAGVAWIRGNNPRYRAAAAAAYARSEFGPEALRMLMEHLNDPVAYYRMRMLEAIEQILGRPLTLAEYDPHAPPARRKAQHQALTAEGE